MVPPAPGWPRGEAAILKERAGPVGVALWQASRDVRLWAGTAPPKRLGLFRPAGGALIRTATLAVPEIERPLQQLDTLVRAPDGVGAPEVAAAASELARWAEEARQLATALEFAEAAALADPGSSAAASLAGRLARASGEAKRAAAWYRRAIALAHGDHDAYIRAQLGYGGVMLHIGDYPAARQALRRASRLAVKFGRRGFAAQANHDLLVIACEAGSYEDGAAAAIKALERYPIRHPRLTELAHDYAYLLGRHGYSVAAIPLLQRIRVLVDASFGVQVSGTLARVAGAAGDRGLFETACEEVIGGIAAADDFLSAQAQVSVAAGALALGEWGLAESFLRSAEEALMRRSDRRSARDVAEVRARLVASSPTDRDLARPAPLQVRLAVGAFLRMLEKFPSVRLASEVPRHVGS